MSQPRRWCYYKEDETFVKRAFDPQMSKSVEQAFMNFMRTRANGVNICGAMFDFEKMVCMHNGVAYKLSPNGGYVPYKVVFGGDIEGLNPSDKAFLSKIDPRMIAHKWFWWDSSNGENPFCAFKEEATTDPKWTCYSDSEERKIEQLYEINSNSSDPIPYDTMFCLRFKAMHENARLMIQGRCDDENNPSIPDASKRRRPIFRASYCWCCDNNEGAGEPNWVPYPPDISAHIEEAFINNKPEADISIGVETYTVNFTQGIQFRIEYTFKKCRVKRFGTEIIDSFMNNVGCGYLGLDDVLPPYWDLQEQQFLFSSHLNRCEIGIASRLIASFIPCKRIIILVLFMHIIIFCLQLVEIAAFLSMVLLLQLLF